MVDVPDLTGGPTKVVDELDLTGGPTFSIGLISYRYFTPFADSATFSVAFPDGVIFILNVRRPILPVVLAVVH